MLLARLKITINAEIFQRLVDSYGPKYQLYYELFFYASEFAQHKENCIKPAIASLPVDGGVADVA